MDADGHFTGEGFSGHVLNGFKEGAFLVAVGDIGVVEPEAFGVGEDLLGGSDFLGIFHRVSRRAL